MFMYMYVCMYVCAFLLDGLFVLVCLIFIVPYVRLTHQCVVVLGMTLLGICALGNHTQLTQNIFIQSVNWLAIKIFQTQNILKYVFISAVCVHVCEALYAVYYAYHIGCTNTYIVWGIQTVFLGFASVRLLHARERAMRDVIQN